MKYIFRYTFFYLVVFIINPAYGFGEEKKTNHSLGLFGITKNVTADSSDRELAERYAPILRPSSRGDNNLGVDLRENDSGFSYTDYIPINVNDITSNPERLPNFVLTRETLFGIHRPAGSYPLLIDSTDLLNDIIGDLAFKDSTNYLDFSPIWGGGEWNKKDGEVGYKSLILNPTVYYKIFENKGHDYLKAVQYWFFYFYNDWSKDHPGDWETITVFLDSNESPKEVIFSTHYEANKYSWKNIHTYLNTTHPYVYVSNGGHGSYNHSGNTPYIKVGYTDNHKGDLIDEFLYPRVSSIKELVNEKYRYALEELEKDSWIGFEGRWGDSDSAPPGPRFRKDMPTDSNFAIDWINEVGSNNPPKKPNCELRTDTYIYGNDDYSGPWEWASGYALNGEEIAPDIKANNSDETITLKTGDMLSVSISLINAGSGFCVDVDGVDWWVAGLAPPDWYYFDASTMFWLYASSYPTDLSATHQGQLFNLSSFEVLNISGLPVGMYNFFFAIDTNMNGSLDFDKLYFDSVGVKIIEDSPANISPTANIINPSTSNTYPSGDNITFRGTGTDTEDGALSGSSLVWTSSVDGQIGTGTFFTYSNLSTGTHTITLTATDSEGAVGSDSVSVSITVVPISVFHTLTVNKNGTGTGMVLSLDGGINCGIDCTEDYVEGMEVTLSTTQDADSAFAGWLGGGCGGTGDCIITMGSDIEVTATFNKIIWSTFNLPDTGQWQDSTPIFGEDSDYTINPPSYTDNGNGTVTDNVTGLIWQQKDDNVKRIWNDGVSYCDNLSLAGYSDWRLPEIKELTNIVNYGKHNPAIDEMYFPNTISDSIGCYWSFTPLVDELKTVWCVEFFSGTVGSPGGTPPSSAYVRCVRRGEIIPSFTDNGNGTVTDNVTGLMWQQEDDDTTREWEDAITYCESLSLAGHTNWRLPNIKELKSIVDYNKIVPAINTTYFPNTNYGYPPFTFYWSSSTFVFPPFNTMAWFVMFGGGTVVPYTDSDDKSSPAYVRCLRGGQ